MSVYRNIADKVICMNNAINILTRLLETIFKVVGADELMDGICIIVMKAQVPNLKLHLQLIDYYYEEEESKRGVFESVKMRIRGIISFLKGCRFTDFTKLNLDDWEQVMGEEGSGLSRPRRLSELSSDDQPDSYFMDEEKDEEEGKGEEEGKDEGEEGKETEKAAAVATMNQEAIQLLRSLFGKKTKRILEGKWLECLDPLPIYTADLKANEALVVGNWSEE